MARNRYPLGIQSFEEIRKGNYLYVDKTEYVYDITHASGKYLCFNRPRHFGKSLLVSTFQSYFEGKKELFKGLAIEKLETDWTEYPVLRFDMSKAKHMDKEQLEGYLDGILTEEETKWGYKSEKHYAYLRLMELIKTANEQTGKRVVVLIDDYDAPFLDAVNEKDELEELRDIVYDFYTPLKGCDPYLEFVLLTGITKYTPLGIFSGLNNIMHVGKQDRYAGMCGITKEELLTLMSDDIDGLADELAVSREEVVQKLTDYYGGYHFAWPSPEVLNPFSLLNCFADGKLDRYCFSSGMPEYLIETMRRFKTTPSQMDELYAPESYVDEPTELAHSVIPLLYQNGIISIKDYDEETELCELDVTNQEMKACLDEAFDQIGDNIR